MWWKIILVIVTVLSVSAGSLMIYGISRWDRGTRELRAHLEASRIPVTPSNYDPHELEGLPDPVQRYFQTVLKPGQPMIEAVDINQKGMFNMSEAGEQWRPFQSTQRVITRRPGFDWDARIRMIPGLTVRVHDAYVAGEGVLHASLFGLITVMKMQNTPEIARGELMRFFAETPWYPTALLPSQGIQWEAVDESSAKATLRDGAISLTLLFRFNSENLIESVRAEERGRAVKGQVIPTPWEGRWSDYQFRDAMLIPTAGEVAWILPEGSKPYWRGQISQIHFEFAQ
ncbi:MAG: hypothetical protein ONB13_06225 [candidate division KSB1 bacterium]|nr:hypothetical protein [candidate division KSB1 bacterium]MDZ7335149.1 hypothetical protein [candidate division KSB1 bacterium]MDZ7356832.1 hypothetical protein [candidate division KSB1 bacterium]MDZ7376198.1 hypothetical protein [candidate division KSB1 bacterium]MDZ7401329.1 hypothetical protein [candidate division KSB1 bacterium]